MDATIDVKVCSRCGLTHDKLVVKEFTNKPPRYTHFGACPETQEPILCIIEDKLTP